MQEENSRRIKQKPCRWGKAFEKGVRADPVEDAGGAGRRATRANPMEDAGGMRQPGVSSAWVRAAA